MAAKLNLDQLKRQIEQLRKDSLNVVANANKIVFTGVQKLADSELKALNDYYRSALDSIRNSNKKDLKGMAQQQLDLLQNTATQVISHARESLGIVAETRAELARLVQKGVRGEQVSVAELKKAAAPAQKAVKEVQEKARKAVKTAEKTVKSTAKQVKAGASQAVASGKRNAAAAVKAVEKAVPVPSPNSRASRATSKAKKAASTAVETVSNAISSAVEKVADAVKP
jgi:hypothetical protein